MIRSRAVANNEYLWDNPQKFPEMEKIIIASDSFKGSLSSEEVSDAAAMAIHEVFPDCTVEKIPVADGGEGTSEALMKILGGEMVHLTVHDPLMRPVHASYGITVDGHTAIIDMAQASGLDLLSKEERNPMEATSFGTGEIIADAIRRGCKKIITGLGGSATNDAGMGLLSALGVRFLDRRKIPYAVLLHAKEYGIPVIAIAGSVEDGLEDNLGFDAIIPAAKGPATLEESMQKTKAAENVRNAVFQVMRLIKTVRLRKSSQ